LQVEVFGRRDGKALKFTYHTTHPGMERWGAPGAYTRNVALPLAVGVRLLMQGAQLGYGVGAPEALLPPGLFFEMLAAREIQLHESLLEID
jgi:hypothetical protein